MSQFKAPSPKPNLFEVARGLDNLGFTATALDLMRAVGVNEIQAAASKPAKYVRETNRSAYIHVKVEANVDQQKSILRDFREAMASKKGMDWLPPVEGSSLVEIVLPKARVVCAYRIPLESFQSSKLPSFLNGSKILEAYTRKPRSDAQHHKNKE